jgi:hypothetical protein
VETRAGRWEDQAVTSSPRYATEPDRNVPLAPVALALSVLVAPVGVVLGIIALRRIRREDDAAGARTAVAAIAVGTVVTIAYVALAVALIVLFVLLRDPASQLPPGLRS